MSKFIIDRVTSAKLYSMTQVSGEEWQLLLEIDTNKCYAFHNNCWVQISDNSTRMEHTQKLTPLKCKQCGAPLKFGDKSYLKCEYCGTEYRI